jgi:hypothetical protein
MKRMHAFLPLLTAALLLGACTPVPAAPPAGLATPTPAAPAAPSPTNPPAASPSAPVSSANPAAAAAVGFLANQLGLPVDQVGILSVEPQQWPDGCLGLPSPGEMCAMHVVPGYRVVLKAGEQGYIFRTDRTGAVVRQEKPAAFPTVPAPQSPTPAAAALVSAIAGLLKVAPADVQILSSEPADWPDACLGVSSPGQVCAQVITPGYRVVAQVNGQQVEFHTNQDGSFVRQAAVPASSGPALLEWTANSGACPGAAFTATQVTFAGPGCLSNHQTQAPFPAGERTAELAALAALYQPFTADTPAGKIVFNGNGAALAAPDEQRSLAVWAGLVAAEAISGGAAAGQGLAFTWHRAGGIAGFCDDLTVSLSGFAYPSRCAGGRAGALSRVRLSADQLHQLYAWVDRLQSFNLDQSDPPTAADGMSQRLAFSGAGSQSAAQADRDAILIFASQLFPPG